MTPPHNTSKIAPHIPLPMPPLSNKVPQVSCVLIFMNNALFLAEAIESVIGQTYEHWELLLVDDGATDGSTQIAKHYVEIHPEKIVYLAHPNHANRGKNATRNLGIQKATGELIALLDGDDVWLPDKLTEQVIIFQQFPEAAMVYGRTKTWYSWENTVQGQPEDSFMSHNVEPNTLVAPPHLVPLLLEGLSQTPTTCNAILRRQVFDMIGSFDERYHDIFEDQAFFVKVELYFSVFVADDWWANYRKHPNSSFVEFTRATEADLTLRFSTKLKFLEWVEAYLNQQHYPNTELRRCLQTIQTATRKYLANQQWFPYRWWRQLLELCLWMGRRILPVRFRQWLWTLIGKWLYFGY